MKYPAILHKGEKAFWVEFPDLPGCATQGDTMEELVYMAEDALSGYLRVTIDLGQEIPAPSHPQEKNIIWIEVNPDVAIPITLRKIRQELKLTQKDAAERLKMKQQSYQKLEDVNKFNATIKTLEKVARALGRKFIFSI
jgi:predicted RNase H-like HicB family nuclease/DNA-binding XRE family transcriptional regulator